MGFEEGGQIIFLARLTALRRFPDTIRQRTTEVRKKSQLIWYFDGNDAWVKAAIINSEGEYSTASSLQRSEKCSGTCSTAYAACLSNSLNTFRVLSGVVVWRYENIGILS